MFDRSKIKVVKKSDASAIKAKKVKKVSSRAAAREMVSNVTGWVSDIKQRKTSETKAALELLFTANRQPSES
jgi:Tfp pilus assembly major pilin PilA